MCPGADVNLFIFFLHKHVYSLNLMEKADMSAAVKSVLSYSTNVMYLLRRDRLGALARLRLAVCDKPRNARSSLYCDHRQEMH